MTITIGAAPAPQTLGPFVTAIKSLGVTPTPVSGLGTAAVNVYSSSLFVADHGRVMLFKGSAGVDLAKVIKGARFLLPKIAAMPAAPARISLPQCSPLERRAAAVISPIIVRRDSRGADYLVCGFASPGSSVVVRSGTGAAVATAVGDAEMLDGPHPIAGVPNSYYSQGFGVMKVGDVAVSLTFYPTGDGAAAVALLKDAAKSLHP